MAWFRRKKQNIQTSTEEKKDTPKGLWYKTPTGKVIETEELERNSFVSPEDDFHVRIGSNEYFKILFDEGKYTELDKNISSKDPLRWKDSKKYTDRLKEMKKRTGLTDSIRTGVGTLQGKELVISAMDFAFIGGSLGSVMGEKIVRGIDHAIKNKLPYVLVCKSGGARMMEAGHSLMQLAKVEAKLIQLSEAQLPYITVLTDPTFGGITASFGMMGDITIAEPGALIGFAGPRVIRETIGKDLPEGFQTAEFLLEKGFVDLIVHRQSLKPRLATLIDFLTNDKKAK